MKRMELYNKRLQFQTFCAACNLSEASWQAKWIPGSSLIYHTDGKKACCSSKLCDSQLYGDRLPPLVAYTYSVSVNKAQTAESASQKLHSTLEMLPGCLCLNQRAENLTCRARNRHCLVRSFVPEISNLAYFGPTQEFSIPELFNVRSLDRLYNSLLLIPKPC